jgi:hypothetical protein
MNILITIALACIIAIAWFRHKKSALKVKGAPARTWPSSRTKMGAKRKFVVPL